MSCSAVGGLKSGIALEHLFSLNDVFKPHKNNKINLYQQISLYRISDLTENFGLSIFNHHLSIVAKNLKKVEYHFKVWVLTVDISQAKR